MSALTQGITERERFSSNRKAIIERLERRIKCSEELLAGLAHEAVNGTCPLNWNDLSNPVRCRIHELIDHGYVKVFCRKVNQYHSDYFVKITDEGLSKVLIDKL